MNVWHLVAGATIVFGALAAGSGVASANDFPVTPVVDPGTAPSNPTPSIPTPSTPVAPQAPSVSYVPNDNPATPNNEAGTIQTTMTHDQADGVAWALSPLNPVSSISQQIRQNNQNNACLTMSSTSLFDHHFTPTTNAGPDGLCTSP